MEKQLLDAAASQVLPVTWGPLSKFYTQKQTQTVKGLTCVHSDKVQNAEAVLLAQVMTGLLE